MTTVSQSRIVTLTLQSPLNTSWTKQPVRLWLPGVTPDDALRLTINDEPASFQYTGQQCPRRGAEVFVLLEFAASQTHTLCWSESEQDSRASLQRIEYPVANGRVLKPFSLALEIAAPVAKDAGLRVRGPWAALAGVPQQSEIYCEQPIQSATLAVTNRGPLFEDWELRYQFAQQRSYTVRLRFWAHEAMVEVAEQFSLGMNASLTWTLNPGLTFDSILSRDSFEGESQPTLESLVKERTRDVLCRLQMPVLTEYFIPNNRGWFALLDERDHAKGMLGVLGLYGSRWSEPVANMPELLGAQGTVRWSSSLASGSRFFLLHHGPVQKAYTTENRLVFHRLHAQFNACRLDEHLDLGGEQVFDASCWNQPALFANVDLTNAARERVAALPPLQRIVDSLDAFERSRNGRHALTFRTLIEPTPTNQHALYQWLIARFERWAHQFQGYRTGQNDYEKNVIGFSRWLRGMLITYELLRKQNSLTDSQIRTLNAYFIFAARRITDLGRWPHDRTTLHPDHPQSVRDLYTYGGEHKPDKLYWTNSLPNFQSDPLCALAHLSAIFNDHPDAEAWRRLALDDIDGQLDAYCGQSGAWQESINYALYTLSYFVITFRVLKQRLGIDYFHDPRVRRLVTWLVEYFGPYDKRFDSWTWPGVGNAVLPQRDGEYLLAFAGELDESDPLREQCLAIYKRCEPNVAPWEHYPTVLCAMAPIPGKNHVLAPVSSKCMDEVGVSMRHESRTPQESYLFQKIGFAKDHYEADETSFNWYAKGTPLCMDYGTYTGDIGIGGAHNIVEIPDEDNLRRGYLKAHHFTPLIDFTHCEVPVTLKLLWGRVRSFEEVENKDGKVDRTAMPYFYIGDKNPVGPKVWKTRLLMFVKPDYVALFDRVIGRVPHRYNLHVTGDSIQVQGQHLSSRGRFDLDLLGFVQHPRTFRTEQGHLIPRVHPAGGGPEAGIKHAQHYVRLYNPDDGAYRTLLFARERNRNVRIESCGQHGMRVITPQYTDVIFLNDEVIDEDVETATGPIRFVGRSGWIRQTTEGQVQAMLIDGDRLAAFGRVFEGRGPWSYNLEGTRTIRLLGGPPRTIRL